MKTISMVVCGNPASTASSIAALTEALIKLKNSDYGRLIFVIDPEYRESIEICESAAAILAQTNTINSDVWVNALKVGFPGNTLIALDRAFNVGDSDFNVVVDGDAAISPDALVLADWFYECHGGPLSEYLLMSLHQEDTSSELPDPGKIRETLGLTESSAWCLSKWQWPFVRDNWCAKKLLPNDWISSLLYFMRLSRRVALCPALSRCSNLGEEISDGSYEGSYTIASRLTEAARCELDAWMVPEYGCGGRRG